MIGKFEIASQPCPGQSTSSLIALTRLTHSTN